MIHNRISFGAILVLAALLFTVGCAQTGQMIDQARYDPLEPSDVFADGKSARSFQPGTVPYMEEGSPSDPLLTGVDEDGEPFEGFPVEITNELVRAGQERYQIFCTPCHGATGEGNGQATTFGFPKPPTLINGNQLSNGQIFNIITNGQGVMFPYGYRVKANERWAVIAYIRAMQQKGGAVNPMELTPDELNQLGAQQ